MEDNPRTSSYRSEEEDDADREDREQVASRLERIRSQARSRRLKSRKRTPEYRGNYQSQRAWLHRAITHGVEDVQRPRGASSAVPSETLGMPDPDAEGSSLI